MRLISAQVAGFGRLLDSKVNLDSKVIAVVGPNEAGKTTLLDALAFVDKKEPLAATRRSRGAPINDDSIVVRVRLILDPADVAALDGINLESKPVAVEMSRPADAHTRFLQIEPYPIKSKAALKSALSALSIAVESINWDAIDEAKPSEEPEEDIDDKVNIRSTLDVLQQRIDQLLDSPTSRQDATLLDDMAAAIQQAESELDAPSVLQALADCQSWLSIPEPEPEVRKRLARRTPDFILFTDEDRSLSSSYSYTRDLMVDPPAALLNLTLLAKLDMDELWNATSTGDLGRRETLLMSANHELGEAFARSWHQSRLTVQLRLDGDVLNILILENGRTITVFHERSAGLRLFVALLAFVATRSSDIPPVLLVDEAETHLHFDAQADLVNTFMSQEAAAKIIYTTHSPACLPPDLGTGIRAVVPDSTRPQVSQIHNSLWHHSAGFSPLLMAMGAGAAAFSTTRYVVLAEGTSEMILLPSLIRVATGLASLPYQVAPGLSEAPTRLYPDLDLEAARVTYLVDGDAGGRSLREGLEKSGVPSNLIISLGAVTLENLLDPAVYGGAVHKLLVEINGANALQPPSLDTETDPWPTVLSKWAKSKKIEMPSKVAVATRIVEDGRVSVSDAGRATLNHLHSELKLAFRLP